MPSVTTPPAIDFGIAVLRIAYNGHVQVLRGVTTNLVRATRPGLGGHQRAASVVLRRIRRSLLLSSSYIIICIVSPNGESVKDGHGFLGDSIVRNGLVDRHGSLLPRHRVLIPVAPHQRHVAFARRRQCPLQTGPPWHCQRPATGPRRSGGRDGARAKLCVAAVVSAWR